MTTGEIVDNSRRPPNAASRATRTLAASFQADRNSLNAIRLALAALVIIDHAWSVGGFGNPPHAGGMDPGGWAVGAFFAISGWLITGSRLSTNLPRYLWRRFLRIYPGMLACLIAIAFVAAPLATVFGPGNWHPADALDFLRRDACIWIGQTQIGDSLAANPSHNWNSQMWTLFHESSCYVLIGLLAAVGRRYLGVACISWWIVGTGLLVVERLTGDTLPYTLHSFVLMGTFFAAGAVLRLYRHQIPDTRWIAACAVGVLFLSVALSAGSILGPLPVAYLCMWLSIRLPFHAVGRCNDFSYGMYVYGLPAQQILAIAGLARIGLLGFALLGIVATFPLAMLSWFAVEKPALKLKDVGVHRDGRVSERGRRRKGSPDRPGSHQFVPSETVLVTALEASDAKAPSFTLPRPAVVVTTDPAVSSGAEPIPGGSLPTGR